MLKYELGDVEKAVLLGTIPVMVFWGILEFCGALNLITFPRPPYKISDLVGGFESLAMVALTAAIYVVYTQQRELAEYHQSAILQLESHDVISQSEYRDYLDKGGFDNITLYHADPVEFTLSNFGRAPGTDLRAELYFSDDNGTEFTTDIQLVKGNWKEATERMHSNSTTALFHNLSGNAIPSQSQEQSYTALFLVNPETIPSEWKPAWTYRSPPPASVLQYAKDAVEHDSDFTLGLHIWHTDGVGLQGPIFARYVTVPQDEIIAQGDFDDVTDVDDMLDLKELFEVGSPATQDTFPDLVHPSER